MSPISLTMWTLSIPKLHRYHCCRLRMDKEFHPTFSHGCDKLSMAGLKLIQCPKWGHRCLISLKPCGAYMHLLIVSPLVEVMACRPFGAKPLSQIMLTYCELAYSSKIWINILRVAFMKMRFKISSAKWWSSHVSLNELLMHQAISCLA